jgi:hypothetical protein
MKSSSPRLAQLRATKISSETARVASVHVAQSVPYLAALMPGWPACATLSRTASPLPKTVKPPPLSAESMKPVGLSRSRHSATPCMTSRNSPEKSAAVPGKASPIVSSRALAGHSPMDTTVLYLPSPSASVKASIMLALLASAVGPVCSP